MGRISDVLRSVAEGKFLFFCPGCQMSHIVDSSWTWNGNADRPTFRPSVLVRSGHYSSLYRHGDGCWCTYNADHPNDPASFACVVCHSWVTDGQIQFLGDSTHALAGKTVPLPPLPDYMRD